MNRSQIVKDGKADYIEKTVKVAVRVVFFKVKSSYPGGSEVLSSMLPVLWTHERGTGQKKWEKDQSREISRRAVLLNC